MEHTVAGAVLAAPGGSRETVRIEISAEFNVTAVAARQKANRHLLMNLGDQLHAGEPELMIGERLWWRVPVLLSLSQGGYLGKVGEPQVDAQSGAVESDPPSSLTHMADYADMLYVPHRVQEQPNSCLVYSMCSISVWGKQQDYTGVSLCRAIFRPK